MIKANKIISKFMVAAFMATSCFSFMPVNAATKKITKTAVVKPKIQLASVLKKEYSIGEKVFFQVKTPNYSGNVQYTVKLFNSTKNKAITSKYYTDLTVANGAKLYSIGWRISEPGTYFMTIYVKRAGTNVTYDSYVKTIYFLVKKPSGNGGVVVLPAVYSENDVLNNNIKVFAAKLLSLNIVNRNIAITTGLKNSNLETSVIDITLNQNCKDKNLADFALILRDKIKAEGKDIDAEKLAQLKGILTSLKISDKTASVYLADKLQDKPHGATIAEFLRKLDKESYGKMYDKLASADFDSNSEIVAVIKEVIAFNQEIAISQFNAFGMSIKKVKVGDKVVFDAATGGTLSINDIKTALGIASDDELLEKTLGQLVNSYNSIEITVESAKKISYKYQVNIKLGAITQK